MQLFRIAIECVCNRFGNDLLNVTGWNFLVHYVKLQNVSSIIISLIMSNVNKCMYVTLLLEQMNVLKSLLNCVRLPHNQDKNKVRTYLNAQTEITSKDGVLLRDSRVIIPTAFRARVLNMLQLTHIEIVRMQSLARIHVWWPNIEVDIAAHCKDCTACAETGPNLLENLSAWPVPDGPQKRIHIDFAGPFLDDMWLVVMDAYSKWPHVLKLNKLYPTSETTMSALDDLFAI